MDAATVCERRMRSMMRVRTQPNCAVVRRLQKNDSANGAALQKFLTYVLSKPDTWLITYTDLIAWMQARA